MGGLKNQIMGKLLKLKKSIFIILHLVVAVVFVVVDFQFQLVYLKNRPIYKT